MNKSKTILILNSYGNAIVSY